MRSALLRVTRGADGAGMTFYSVAPSTDGAAIARTEAGGFTMANRSRRNVPTNSDQAAQKRRGGQELPDDVQDRPEQNAGYDAAVRQGPPQNERDDRYIDSDLVDLDDDADVRRERRDVPPRDEPAPQRASNDIDDRAERSAESEIRRRERRT